MHLAAPAADLRLAALTLGFDDALTLDTSDAEFRGRLILLDERDDAGTGAAGSAPVSSALDLDLSARVLCRGRLALHLRPKGFGLRAPIEPDPTLPNHLLTARGVGYRFEAPAR